MSYKFHLEHNETVKLETAQVILQKQTQYQLVQIVQLHGLGNTIFIDGFPQSSAGDHKIFNETLVHAALCSAPQPQRIFVAGVATGSSIEEILKHPSIIKVYAIDIDREAVTAFRTALPEWGNIALTDARVEVIYRDARATLEGAIGDNDLDAIIIDLPDPTERSGVYRMFTTEFYNLCARKLNRDGVLITQSGRFRLNAMEYHNTVRSTCRSVFKSIKTYQFFYPCYYEPWSFLLCHPRPRYRFPSARKIDKILTGRGITSLTYYSGSMDRAMATLGKVYEAALDEDRPALRDL